MFACCWGEGTELLGVVRASCVSGARVYLLFRSCMSLQRAEGFVLKVMVERVSFQMALCCARISSVISVLSACRWLMISGVGNCLRRWLRVLSLWRISLLRPGQYRLTAPVGMCCLLLCMMIDVRCFVAALMSVKVLMSKSVSACSMLFVKESQSARL